MLCMHAGILVVQGDGDLRAGEAVIVLEIEVQMFLATSVTLTGPPGAPPPPPPAASLGDFVLLDELSAAAATMSSGAGRMPNETYETRSDSHGSWVDARLDASRSLLSLPVATKRLESRSTTMATKISAR